MIKLIIFDLDDTLYKENDYVRSWFQAVANYVSDNFWISQSKVFKYLWSTFQRYWRWKNFDMMINHFCLQDLSLKKLVNIYREHRPNINLTKGKIVLLKKLKKRYKLCMITNGYPEVQKKKIKALDMKTYFDKIYYADEQWREYGKPHRKYFELALRQFRISPKNALMVGDDHECDILGAKSVGINTLNVNTKTLIQKLKNKLSML